ncbi:MAG: phosphodiester glycosidase family protein [Clostridia bacterium]|nr:phosphodiester glycosidase family protein [Clostridia bacterium]
MQQELRTFQMQGGGFTRVQRIVPGNWHRLRFFSPEPDAEAFSQITGLYRDFIVPRYRWLYAKLAFFRLPRDIRVPDVPGMEIADPLLRATLILRYGMRLYHATPRFSSPAAEALWHTLASRGCTAIVPGLRPGTVILPVGAELGFLTRSETTARLRANLGFFTMDRIDCMTAFDRLGTPLGLRVQNGKIVAPPLFGREALLVRNNGDIRISKPDLTDLTLTAAGKEFVPGKNAALFSRPSCRKTPPGRGTELVIVHDTVLAVTEGGGTPVPSSGFVLRTDDAEGIRPGDRVSYHGLEDVRFGVQCGNAAVENGVPVLGFRSPFWNIRRPFGPSYPPSLYPLDYKRDRAPRMLLGADKCGEPVLLWFEGRPKFGDDPETESRGASLSEVASIAAKLGVVCGVNLDGGGSAQILTREGRALRVSDRDPSDHSERERAVPEGLCVL